MSSTTKGNAAPPWKGYVNVDVTDDMIDALVQDGSWTYSEMDDLIDVWASLGYTYAARFDDSYTTFEASLYGSTQLCVNAGIKVNAKAPTLAEANQLLVMKVELLGSTSWEAFLGQTVTASYR